MSGKSMIVYKKEREKIEVVARPGLFELTRHLSRAVVCGFQNYTETPSIEKKAKQNRIVIVSRPVAQNSVVTSMNSASSNPSIDPFLSER